MFNKADSTIIQILLASFLLFIVACGGGGNDQQGNTWQQGVFRDEDNFKNLCQNPRSGIDPVTDQAYADTQGAVLDENNWLRSWSNRTYLWYDEIIDRDPSLYPTTEEYFALLVTDGTTNSGAPKDNFHFSLPTEEWQQQQQAGTSSGYGARWAFIRVVPPRNIRVAFTEPGTTGETNLSRGAEILQIDGVDVVNDNTQAGLDIIDAGLFPDDNETHEFVVRDVGSNQTRTFSMTSSVITSSPVQKTTTFTTSGETNVGYFLFNTFNLPSEQALIDAITELANANVDELILDLRYNGGGLLAISAELAYMIAGSDNTDGKTFYQTVFNDKHTRFDINGSPIEPFPFFNTAVGFSAMQGQTLPSLNLTRVFILSTASTCSASEAVINGLRGAGVEVILIGGTTCGKPYGFFPTDNCGTTYFTIQFSGNNDMDFGEYSEGFSPANLSTSLGEPVTGCAVDDDFENPLGDQQEDLLEIAVFYIDNNTCPTPTKTAQTNKSKNSNGLSLFNSKRYQRHQLLNNNGFLLPKTSK